MAKESKLNHFCEMDHTHQVATHPNLDIRKYTKDMFSVWKQQMKNKLYVNANIKNEYLQEWKKEEHERKHKWKTYSIKYLNKVYNEICSMLDYAIGEGYCTYNFAKQSGKIGTAKEIKLSSKSKEYDIIDYEEYLMLMEATKYDLKYNTMFDMLFTRGPRVGEIRAFQVCNYDYANSRINVECTMAKGNILKEPKTSSSKDWIYLGDKLNRKINNLINEQKKQNGFDDSCLYSEVKILLLLLYLKYLDTVTSVSH